MIEYDPATGFPIFRPDGAVLRAFKRDRTSAVKIIQRPQGSGTSSACCIHVFQQALAQPKQRDGRQRFRAHIFRETYAKIEATVLQTWLDWFKPGTKAGEFGIFYETRPYRHEVRVGPLELDVTFMALEDIRDAKSYFDSLEPSLLWFNEGQHAQLAVIRHGLSRVSPPRFPAVKDGGCAWGGLIIDTNAPPADHWIPIMRGDTPIPEGTSESDRQALKKPDNWTFYLQPPGLVEEFDAKDESATEFAPALKAYLAQHYPGFTFNFWGDPAGGKRGEANDETPFMVFRQHGMIVLPAPNPQNQLTIRHEAVNAILMRRSNSGQRPSAMLVSPRCVTFITGMSGGYFLRRIRVSSERYSDQPEKNGYSHICFATGTPIATAHGPVPIETLRTGDLVCTPMGLRPVKATMARMAAVAQYEFSSGRKLVCTPDHPFFTRRGFVAIDAVEYSDQLATENFAWNVLFRLSRLALMRSGRSSRFAECAITTGRMVISAISAAAIFIAGFGRL